MHEKNAEKSKKALKINNINSKQLNKKGETSSCGSCGACSRLKSPQVSSEGVSTALSHAKAVGKESCALSFMQSNYGNRFTASVLSPTIQKKCSCGGSCSGCKEEEAERISMSIMRMESPGINLKPSAFDCQPSVKNEEQAQISEIISSKSSGQRLQDNTRSFMDERFGYDFSHVRIHTDSHAARKSDELNAEAFTIGRDVFFNAGRYRPSSAEGKKLLSHELTHVIQQGKAPQIQLRTERRAGYRVDDAEDCAGNWQDIGVATAEARRMVQSAINALGPGARAAERIRNALQRHFHLDQRAIDETGNYSLLLKLTTVINNFRYINNAFSGTIPFECERTNDGWFCRVNRYGYVRLIWSDIHLCPHWFAMTPRNQARGIVHEMSHKYAGTDDEAYEHNPEYRNLSVNDAIDNADSYACFARDVS